MMSESQYKMPKVDIVLISYNTQNLLLKCLHSLFLTPQGIELGNVIIVDNASSDKTIENIKAYYPGCIIIGLPNNIGYAGAVNEGMKRQNLHGFLLVIQILNSEILLYQIYYNKPNYIHKCCMLSTTSVSK